MNYKKELKKRISADYERRVKQWMAADPSQLIDAAEGDLSHTVDPATMWRTPSTRRTLQIFLLGAGRAAG
ncbi:MAG: hypothetical protein V8R55_13295 [Dysosmobacter sp.]